MREHLAETLGDVYWTDLRAHVVRDAVIIVADDLDLLDVGVAIASDDVPTVDAWIEAGKLSKPTQDDLIRWPLDATTRFRMLIVQPYVLVRRPKVGPPS